VHTTRPYEPMLSIEFRQKLVHLASPAAAACCFVFSRTKGIIGNKFIQLSPGNSEKLISAGGTIRDTESNIDLEELISSFIHGKV